MSNPMDALQSKFRRLAEAREDRDIAKKAAEKAEEEYREIEADLIRELEESGIRGSLKFDFGELGTVSFRPGRTIYGQIIDAEAAMESFEREALVEEMTTPKFQSRRLNEYVKERLENQQELPPGVGFYERKYMTISRKQS